MTRRNSPPAEPLEQRWFLSTATESEHTAPHPAPAVHAPATPATPSAETETSDGESAAPVAAPTPAPTPSTETEDQAATTPGASTPAPAPVIEAAPAQAPAPSPAAPIPPVAPIVKAILTDSTAPALPPTTSQPETELTPAIFNTRHPITPQDVETQPLLAPLTYPAAVTQAVAEVARSPLVVKPATEAILSLTRTDLLATFADAIASFAHESAATPAASLASIETHHYKWHVTLGVLGIDAVLIGHWYATRRRNTRTVAPFSTKSV